MFALNSHELVGRRILVVEDEYVVAEEMARAVRNNGGEVVGPVPSVGQALALIESGERVDAAILDINLDGRTVFPVAKALQDRGIPIIFVTGYDNWMIPQDYEDVPLFRKPEDPENVVRLLFQK